MATLLDFFLIFYAYFSLRNCQYEVEQPELDVKHYYRWLNLRSQFSTTWFEFIAKSFIKNCPQFSEFWKVLREGVVNNLIWTSNTIYKQFKCELTWFHFRLRYISLQILFTVFNKKKYPIGISILGNNWKFNS